MFVTSEQWLRATNRKQKSTSGLKSSRGRFLKSLSSGRLGESFSNDGLSEKGENSYPLTRGVSRGWERGGGVCMYK